MFYSETNRPPIIPAKKTSKFEPEYEERIDTKTGMTYLKKTGETNVYERIQASKDSTDIQKIVERYQITLENKPEMNMDEVLDYTNIPGNLIEAQQLIIKAKQLFEKEPKDIREKYNGNFNEYLMAAQSGELKETYQKVFDRKFKAKEPVTQVLPKEKTIERVVEPQNIYKGGNEQ